MATLRAHLLEKMEEEGKLKTEGAITPEPPKEVEAIESNADSIVPKKRTRRRKVR